MESRKYSCENNYLVTIFVLFILCIVIGAQIGNTKLGASFFVIGVFSIPRMLCKLYDRKMNDRWIKKHIEIEKDKKE